MRLFVNTWPKYRAGFIRRRGTIAAKKTLVEVCKDPSEKQLGGKQETKKPFILPFNEKLCQGTISLGWKV